MILPTLAQFQLDINQLVLAVGVPSTIGIVVVVMVLLVVRSETKQALQSNTADVEQQRTVTKMMVNASEQVGNIQATVSDMQSKMLEMSEQRAKDRETISELKGKLDLAEYKIIQLTNHGKQMDKKFAAIEFKKKQVTQERDRLRRELENATKTIESKDQQIAFLTGQIRSITQLEEDEVSQDYQQKAPTQRIPDLFIEDTGDTDTLMTPIVKPLDNNSTQTDTVTPERDTSDNTHSNDDEKDIA